MVAIVEQVAISIGYEAMSVVSHVDFAVGDDEVQDRVMHIIDRP